MLKTEDLLKLAKIVGNANPSKPVAYSFNNEDFDYDTLHETLRNEFKLLAGTPQLYRENKNTVFSILERTIDDVLPKRVLESYGQFADIQHIGNGDTAVFHQNVTAASKRRAKQFVTKVGLAGVYEVFKLDGRSYTVPTSAFGAAAQITFEEFLDGRMNFAELLDIVLEGLDEAIYVEIERALIGAVTNLQPANQSIQTSFDEAEMDRLLSVADAYGQSTIYCTFEFAATMIPANKDLMSSNMKDTLWNNGYFTTYKRHRVVVLPQSFETEANDIKVIDPSYAWIIPTGGDKPVKVVFQGNTLSDERKNYDWSTDIHFYKKVGVAAIITNNICVYRNTSLTKTA